MKTKIKVINETAAHYNSNNRGNDGLSCVYDAGDGNRCAVGRCMTPEALEKSLFVLHSNYAWGSVRNIEANIENHLFQFPEGAKSFLDLLREEYQIDDLKFWKDLQQFHDEGSNWDDQGLSERGKKAYKILLDQYKGQ